MLRFLPVAYFAGVVACCAFFVFGAVLYAVAGPAGLILWLLCAWLLVTGIRRFGHIIGISRDS